jgi:hypothetical protein
MVKKSNYIREEIKLFVVSVYTHKDTERIINDEGDREEEKK